MANGASVHLPVGIPLMTDAALVRTLFEFRQQMASGTPEIPGPVQSQIVEAIGEIEAELRDREIDPDEADALSALTFASANVVKFVSLDVEG